MHKSSIYLITNGEYCKIGRTSNSVKQRVNSIQSSHPTKLTILHSISKLSHNQSLSEELALHTIFRDCRQSGEWFKLTSEQIDQCTQLMNSIIPDEYIPVTPAPIIPPSYLLEDEVDNESNHNLPEGLYIDDSPDLPEGCAWIEDKVISTMTVQGLVLSRVYVNLSKPYKD